MTTATELSPRWGRVVHTIDAISTWSGKAFAWLIVPMVCGLVYEVFSRYLFNSPTLWA